MRVVDRVNEGELPFGRVLLAGEVHDCLFDDDRVILLDRPAYASGAQPVGEAALGDCRLLAPVQPTKVVAVGLNYRAHAEEFAAAPPSEPLLFLKPPSAVVGSGAAIVLPPQSRRVDYEAELALVVGRRATSNGATASGHGPKASTRFAPWDPGLCGGRPTRGRA